MPHRAILRGKKVIIVDDDFHYRTYLLSVLKKAGAICTISVNSESAKIKLSAEQYDIIILDYILPGQNALEIIKWLREQNIETPVLIVTAYPSEELSEKCRDQKKVTVVAKIDLTVEHILIALADMLKQ